MKLAQSIAAHSILAVGGLTWAYLVWTDDAPAVDESEVTVFECDPDALTNVELRTEEKDVTLEMREERGSRTAWLTVTRRPENGDPTTEHFVGSSAVNEWLAQVAPLRAKRSLGELSEQQLHEVGLDHPEGRITLRCGGQRTTFQLGGRAYGNGDRYLRADRGPAYLVGSDRLSPLESAEFRLMERELHTFQPREIVSLTVHAFGQEKQLLQHNRLDEQRAEWVDAASPDRRDDTYGNWLSRFPRLRVQKYLAADAQPGADLEGMSATPERVLRIDYQGESCELGFVEITRVDGAEQAYYARSETTRSWVRVPSSVAQQIEDDLRSMLGVEPIEHPSATPRPAQQQGESEGAPQPGAESGAAPTPAPSGTAPTPAPSGSASPPAPPPAAPPSPHAPAPAPSAAPREAAPAPDQAGASSAAP